MKEQHSLTPQGIVALVLGAVCLYWGLNHLSPIAGAVGFVLGLISPFLLGCGFAFLLNIPMRAIERLLRRAGTRKRSWIRPAALVLTLLCVVGVIAGVAWTVVPQLAETVTDVRGQFPSFVRSARGWLTALGEAHPELETLAQSLMAYLDPTASGFLAKVTGFFSGTVTKVLSSSLNLATSVFSGVAAFFIALIFALYLLGGKERLLGQVGHLLDAFVPPVGRRWIHKVAALVDRTFSSFFTGQCLEACILGLLFFLAMSLFRFPYAVLVAVLVGFTALIPVFGAFVGCGVGALLILVRNPMQALGFVVLFLVLQQVEGNFIYPRVVGSSVGLPPIWVLLAVTLGGSTFGVAGMLLFIPGLSVVYTLLREAVHNRLGRQAAAQPRDEQAEAPLSPAGGPQDGEKQNR